jgi:hypothetical protein
MTYENLSGILSDVIGFIKTFVATLKDFIHGFKSETRFETEPYEAD